MRAKITKRSVEAVKVGSRDQFVWDTELPGFGCKVTPPGRRVYVLQVRIKNLLRRLTIGQHGAITAEQARKEALRLHAEIAAGSDPIALRRDSRTAPTVSDLSSRYLAEHATVYKKARSVREDEKLLRVHILPALGSKRVPEVTREHVARLHHRLREKPFAANRVLALLSKMFNLAEQWGLRPDGSNPCRHVKKYREKKRERYLTELELARLGKVLNKAEDAGTEPIAAINAIRLLIFTGCRLSEILTLRWSDVDLERGYLHLHDTKTGDRDKELNEPARAVLEGIERSGEWVIPGAKAGSHLVGINHIWQRIRKQAGIEDVRLHDLRHTFASVAVARGVSLPVIGGILGHRNQATTARYAHLADDPLRRASEDVGQEIANIMGGRRLRRVK